MDFWLAKWKVDVLKITEKLMPQNAVIMQCSIFSVPAIKRSADAFQYPSKDLFCALENMSRMGLFPSWRRRKKNNFGIFMIYAMSCWWEAERRWLERTKTTSHLKSGPESPRILSFSLSALLWSQVLLINSEETLSEQIIFCAFLFFLLICVFKAFFDSRFLSPDSNIAGPYKFLICFVSVVAARSALTTSL